MIDVSYSAKSATLNHVICLSNFVDEEIHHEKKCDVCHESKTEGIIGCVGDVRKNVEKDQDTVRVKASEVESTNADEAENCFDCSKDNWGHQNGQGDSHFVQLFLRGLLSPFDPSREGNGNSNDA